jgi:hypothetical protein
MAFGEERDPGYDSLGTGVEAVETRFTVYISSDDVVALMERLDEYLSNGGLSLVTLDRTNNGQFYAFLTRASNFI